MNDKDTGSGPMTALTSSVFLWGLTPVATKFALTYTSANSLLFSRFLLTLVFGSILLKKVHLHGLTPRLIAGTFLLGICGVAIYQLLITSALEHMPASEAGIILGLEPILIQVIMLAHQRQRLTLRNIVALFLGLGGVIVVSLAGTKQGISSNLLGVALALLSAICWSIYVVASRNYTKVIGAFRYSVMSLTFGSLCIAAFVFTTDSSPNRIVPTHPAVLLATIAFLSLFATLGALMAWNYAAKFVSPQLQGATLYAIPLISCFGGALLLNEHLDSMFLIGVSAVLLSIHLSRSKTHQRRSFT